MLAEAAGVAVPDELRLAARYVLQHGLRLELRPGKIPEKKSRKKNDTPKRGDGGSAVDRRVEVCCWTT